MSPGTARALFDVAVLGAGPAGLAAAAAAAAAGARVALVDAGRRPGGQYWRHRESDTGPDHGGSEFRRLQHTLTEHAGTVELFFEHSVWLAEPLSTNRFRLHADHLGEVRTVDASTVVVATGAYDRQLPFPGWTLPGVFTAGGAQALLKGEGVLAGSRVVVTGTGPFLLVVAAGLARGGADVLGVYEAGGPPMAFARHPGVMTQNPGKLGEVLRYGAVMARHRIPYRTRTAVIAVHGTGSVTGVTTAKLDREWNVLGGSQRLVDCDTVAVGYGFTPQLELAVQLGCATRLDLDGSLVAAVDDDQLSSVPGVYIAGETTGIGGAALSLVEGEIAGRHAAGAAGHTEPNRRPRLQLRRRRTRNRAFAEILQEQFQVRPGWMSWTETDTVVCRCEEVTAGEITTAVVDLGAIDPRGVKLYARPGMGLCQGRVCGYAVSCLVAAQTGGEPTGSDLQGVANRPIAQPITLGALAADIEQVSSLCTHTTPTAPTVLTEGIPYAK